VSKCKPPTIADDVRRAAHGRNVVLSSGSIDGPLLQALQRAQLAAGVCGDNVSTWGPGVTNADNANLSVAIQGAQDDA